MRKPRTHEDLCLLCRKSRASKIESHIYPKFFTQSMFGDKHSKQGSLIASPAIEKIKEGIDAGEQVDTSKAFKPATDTAKEKYLLCADCENKRLGSLETYISDYFYKRYRNPFFADDFATINRRAIDPTELDVLLCKSVNIGMFKLFVYSMVWRASVSSLLGFRFFKLHPQTEEVLRRTLDTYLQDRAVQTQEFYNKNEYKFPQYQFTVFTSVELPTAKRNLTANPHDFENGELIFFINEFIIKFYTRWDEQARYNPTMNSGVYPPMMVLLKEPEWRRFIDSFTQGVISSILDPATSDSESIGYFWSGDSPVEYRNGFKQPIRKSPAPTASEAA